MTVGRVAIDVAIRIITPSLATEIVGRFLQDVERCARDVMIRGDFPRELIAGFGADRHHIATNSSVRPVNSACCWRKEVADTTPPNIVTTILQDTRTRTGDHCCRRRNNEIRVNIFVSQSLKNEKETSINNDHRKNHARNETILSTT